MNSIDVLESLVHRLDGPLLSTLKVIPWAAPVLSFGSLERSKVATVGLNPSNREFVDIEGNELTGRDRRFPTLASLRLDRWSSARRGDLEEIKRSCDDYFIGNPYDGWFRSLDKIIVGAKSSYYGIFSDACHLDLVPYATACKWIELSSAQRSELLACAGDALGLLLKNSSVEMLILNGKSVIEHLQLLAGGNFSRKLVPDWTLPRRESNGVSGYAYSGSISAISGVQLGREISVLGFSHNIQSSYGVTSQVKESISRWIGASAVEVFAT